MQAIYRALAAEAVSDAFSDGSSHSQFGQNSRKSAPTDSSNQPAGLLHATISRYFDQGPVTTRRDEDVITVDGDSDVNITVGSNVVVGDDADGETSSNNRAISPLDASIDSPGGGHTSDDGFVAPLIPTDRTCEFELKTCKKPLDLQPLPHQSLDKRAWELLVRDASVLLTDPSFQGRLDAGFDDDGNGGRGDEGGGRGLGFFEVSTGRTGAIGGEGGVRGTGVMAPHSWLLKVRFV